MILKHGIIVKLRLAASAEFDDNLYGIAATDEKDSALMLTYFNDDDSAEDKTVRIEMNGAKRGECVKAEVYLINESNSLELVKEEYFTSDKFALILKMKNYDVALIKLTNA